MVKYREQQIGQTFYALSDETRRKLLERLSNESPLTVLELAEPFDISVPAVSKHIKILEKANLITRRQSGRTHSISFNPTPMIEASSWLEKYQQFWDQKLLSLEKFINKQK